MTKDHVKIQIENLKEKESDLKLRRKIKISEFDKQINQIKKRIINYSKILKSMD